MSGGRLLALDGLRGVAAIGVMAMHADFAGLPVRGGYLAVDLFFLLSGFVIARSYEPQLRSGAMDLRGYALVRLERLYPMLFIGGMLGLGLFAAGLSDFAPAGQGDMALAIAGQFLLVPFTVTGLSFAFNGAQWSIVLELLANFAHAAALPRLTNRGLTLVVAGCALALALSANRFGSLDIGWTRGSFAFGLSRVGFGFFAGVLLHRTHARWQGLVPKLSFWLPALAFIAIANRPEALSQTPLMTVAYDLAAVLIVFPPLVMLCVEAGGGRLAAVLGTLSYPIYAIHYEVMTALHVSHAGEPAKVLAATLLLPLAWVLGRWVDEPLNALRRRARKAARERRQMVAA